MTKKTNLFANLNSDFPAGLVVFLVALPLCLGIALASGAPLFSGIISGVIGGIVVGYLSKSHLSVSGPAAGLTAIVLTAITALGDFRVFLLAAFIAGILQLILGYIKAGSISNYFPTNVIEGMLAGIGIIIFLKQIPHAFGLDKDFLGDLSFLQSDGKNTFSEIMLVIENINLGSVIITIVSLAILILWDKVTFLKKLKLVPAALIAVIVGVFINELFIRSGSSLAITSKHLVSLPVPTTFDEFKNIIITPDFSAIANKQVWVVAFTITIVASIETLLCIEAADRMDIHKRYTDTNVELKAQGIGNVISALLGGLPMTSVVVRTSANSNAGAQSKMAAIIHGVLLLVSALAIPFLLNKIPLATLAAILLLVGYKLANPKIIKHFFEKGKYQFIPFICTLLAVVFTDLLKGVALGVIISIIFILKGNMQRAYIFRKETLLDGDTIHIDLAQEVSFLNKAAIKLTLASIPENSKVIINASDTVYIAHDVLDLIQEFEKIKSIEDNINVKLVGFKKAYDLVNTGEEEKHVFVEHKPV
ncbi:SulP family inorganic anion transporter [Flavobacterium psychrophilum]|uniref:SulP family inorganic anion transporter n=1 Tax=Flavobacterium psychrophilum TaxID=96345 RepID=UPI000B7C31C8|nr:SulP family inorganic anion transporter [Flavobacterium psychrophilum]EKT3966237.1 SulP family inorganic anion transporter [Flavobacterium psychrophilum]EKT4519342.1 SulP family inorganic anion transporter [Flavobacterium psychrophilum]SNB24804.1 putative sulfate permease [Flavobacterium psychrophilum]